jgi:hypothetical protein
MNEATSGPARRIYRVLLAAYPREHRERYGPEMEDAFLTLLRRDAERLGVVGRLRCWGGAAWDAALGGAAARIAEARGNQTGSGGPEMFCQLPPPAL